MPNPFGELEALITGLQDQVTALQATNDERNTRIGLLEEELEHSYVFHAIIRENGSVQHASHLTNAGVSRIDAMLHQDGSYYVSFPVTDNNATLARAVAIVNALPADRPAPFLPDSFTVNVGTVGTGLPSPQFTPQNTVGVRLFDSNNALVTGPFSLLLIAQRNNS